jgi:hypothetical protein
MADLNWGGRTDHWGWTAGVGPLASKAVVVNSSKEPRSKSRDNVEGGTGDIVDSEYYGAGSIEEVSVEYLLTADLDLSDLYLGELETGKVINSITVPSNPKAGMKIVVAGQFGNAAIVKPDGLLSTYFLPSFSVGAGHFVYELGFAVTSGEIQSATATFTAEISEEPNGLGEPQTHGISGAAATLTMEFAKPAGTAAVTLDSFWTATKAAGTTEAQNSWHTTTLTAEGTLTRTVAPA